MSSENISNRETFEISVLKAEKPVLVDFWAPWCGPCKAISPIIDEISNSWSDSLKVVKVNVDEDNHSPSEYGVRGIPTLVLFENGVVLGSIVGAATKEKIETFLKQHID
jgi:thioredoxin 1